MLCLSLALAATQCAALSGYVYADNWFELYINGKLVVTDPVGAAASKQNT